MVKNLEAILIGFLAGLNIVLATHIILAEEYKVFKPGENGWIELGTFHCAIYRPDDDKVVLDNGKRLKLDGTHGFLRIN